MIEERGLGLLAAAREVTGSRAGGRRGVAAAEHAFDFLLHPLVLDADAGERVGGGGFMILHEGEEQMLGADILVAHGSRFLRGDLQDLLRPWGEGNHLADGHHPSGRGDGLLDIAGEIVEIDAEVLEYRHRYPIAFADEAEQEVFGTDIIIAQADGFLTRQLHDLLDPIRKHPVHVFFLVGPEYSGPCSCEVFAHPMVKILVMT